MLLVQHSAGNGSDDLVHTFYGADGLKLLLLLLDGFLCTHPQREFLIPPESGDICCLWTILSEWAPPHIPETMR